MITTNMPYSVIKGSLILLVISIFIFIYTFITSNYIKPVYKTSSSDLVGINIQFPEQQYLVHGQIDINMATKDELIAIPGIGVSLAKKIINYRDLNGNFKNMDDVLNVSGIGHKMLARIKVFLTYNK